MKRVKLIILLVTSLLYPVLGYPNASVTIVCENDFAPYGYASNQGTAAGFSTDIIIASYQAVNIDVNFLVIPYKRGMYMLEYGRMLACYNTNNDQGNLEKHDFAKKPLFKGEMVIWARSDYHGEMTVSQLIKTGAVIGTTNGYNYDAPGVDFDYNDKIEKDVAQSVTLTLLKLVKGRYNFAAAEKRVALLAIARNPAELKGMLKIVGTIAKPGLFLTFSKKFPDSDYYRQRFNVGFGKIKENGIYRMIEKKWDILIQNDNLP